METTLTINASDLSDDALVAELQRLTRNRRELTAELLAHIAEMDARKLYREHACSSMFRYATERLGMSEASAYKHIQVGRAARLFPYIFELLEAGACDYEVHLQRLAHRGGRRGLLRWMVEQSVWGAAAQPGVRAHAPG